MEDFTKEDALEIYYKEYWKKPHFDYIKNSKIATELFEFGVNAGVKTSVKILQRAYNLLNTNDIIKEDGILGSITAHRVNNYKYYKSLFKVMNILQGMYYIALAENDVNLKDNILHHTEVKGGKLKKFFRGWIDKRVNI